MHLNVCVWCFLCDLESHEDDPDTPGKKRQCASIVSPPLEIHMTEEEIRLLRSARKHKKDLGFSLSNSIVGNVENGVERHQSKNRAAKNSNPKFPHAVSE